MIDNEPNIDYPNYYDRQPFGFQDPINNEREANNIEPFNETHRKHLDVLCKGGVISDYDLTDRIKNADGTTTYRVEITLEEDDARRIR